MNYEMRVGLETHIELCTKTKIFCSCKSEFGAQPNTRCCPVCMGLPGALPYLNKEVVKYAVMAGIATNCNINSISYMDRKNYIYPDLPKGYQITQNMTPICYGGYIELSDNTKIRINRIHIEEDAGKLTHKEGETFIDYNRSGVPLIEIVTEPDFKSSLQVKEYLEKIRLIMKTIGISNCRMQEGSMRCDVNISVNSENVKGGVKTEIKNVNSLSFIVKAIDSEFQRQRDILGNGGKIVSETLRYNEKSGKTEVMRSKETAGDYRYFPEPDIPSVFISKEEILEVQKNMPELPHMKKQRLEKECGLSSAECEILIKYPFWVSLFEEAVALGVDAKTAAGIIINNCFGIMKDENSRESIPPITAPLFAEIVKFVSLSKIPKNMIKEVLSRVFEKGQSFLEIYGENFFEKPDTTETKALVLNAISNMQQAVMDYKSGKEKALISIVGRVMKDSGGKADAETVKKLILEELTE